MEDKFELTLRENIFLAKKLLVNNIYHSARLEGCNITFPDTQTILDGVSVGNLKMQDVEVVLNLRDAWKYVINTVENGLTIDYISKINSFVSRNESLDWGVLRYGEVGITGTSYRPGIPIRKEVEERLLEILNSDVSITSRAIKLFLWCCRSQFFWDGNKRTSLISANKLLISNGKGILMIEEEYIREFNHRLSEFYETNDYSVVDEFLYDKCIHGMTIDRVLEKEYKNDKEYYP